MSSMLEFRQGERLLVLAPHPDDETLATGGLIQRALAAHCAVRVLVATDGDNNPWPQRWLEKRWRIDAAARARWGQRRREESRRALHVLGVPADAVRYLGWPDLGLTGLLLDPAAVEHVLAAEIESFRPTHLALPVSFDRHPDHSALRVLAELAITSARHAGLCRLGFVVHGLPLADDCVQLVLDEGQQQSKQRALLEHATQVSLSRRRLLRIAARSERFEVDASTRVASLPQGAMRLRVPRPPHAPWSRRRDLLLVITRGERIVRARIALPPVNGRLQVMLDAEDGSGIELALRVERRAVDISVSSPLRIERGFAKIERSGPGLVIFDAEGWHAFSDCLVDPGHSTEAELSIGKR